MQHEATSFMTAWQETQKTSTPQSYVTLICDELKKRGLASGIFNNDLRSLVGSQASSNFGWVQEGDLYAIDGR